MNIAQRFKEYYEHEDFIDNYKWLLHETFHNNEGDILKRLYTLFNVANYDCEKYFGVFPYVEQQTIQKVYDYMKENIEDFIQDFRNYWVGSTSLDSISFGEQEQQLTGILNHRTGKNYTLPYLRKVCESEDFYVDGEYAYYNLDGGLHIELLNNKDELIKILNNGT